MAYVYCSCAVRVTIFSTGGKFRRVSNFTELHALTHSYALLHIHVYRNEKQLTTPYLITAISAVLSTITAVRGANTLKIAAPKCSSSTRDCNK